METIIKKKKILIFHPALRPYRIDFFNFLSREYDTKFYFSYSESRGHELELNLIKNGIQFEFYLLKYGFEIKNRLFRFGIFRIVKREKPDIILCSEYSQITFAVIIYKYFFNREIKIYTLSDDSIKYSVEREGIRKWIRSWVSNVIDGVILPSELVGRWYSSNVNRHTKVLELPIIHSNSIFRNKLQKRLNAAEEEVLKYNLTGKKVFLFVGRLVALKNIDRLLRAFAQSQNTNSVLIIIGEGIEEKNLKQLSAALNLTKNCKFIGWKEGEELLSWYNVGHCLILASYREAYGAVVNEALLAGCKVLCSDYAGAAVLINERSGYTFDPFNVDQLANLINRVSEETQPVQIPLKLKPDLMPFTFEEKLNVLYSQF